MNLEQEYVEYGLQLSLTLATVSALYFIEMSNPYSFLLLLTVPVLLGYTAFISRDEFRKASFASLIGLFLAPIGFFMALGCVSVVTLNVLVSVFSSGESFRSFYSSTSVPLVITGILFGALLVGGMEFSEDLENQVDNAIVNSTVETVDSVRPGSNGSGGGGTEAINAVSTSTVTVTRSYVVNETEDVMGIDERQALRQAFDNASEDVPTMVAEDIEESTEENSGEMTDRIESIVENFYDRNSRKIRYLMFPLIVITFFSLQPFLGLLTGLFAWISWKVSRRSSGLNVDNDP